MATINKFLFAFIFIAKLCLCASLYLVDRKLLDENNKAALYPDVYSERTFLRFKKHNIKSGGCPKDMVWYYGKCRFKTQKEDNNNNYNLSENEDEFRKTMNDVESTKTISDVFENITPTAEDKLNTIPLVSHPEIKLDAVLTVPTETNGTLPVPDDKSNIDVNVSVPDYKNKTNGLSVPEYKNKTDANVSVSDYRNETIAISNYKNETNVFDSDSDKYTGSLWTQFTFAFILVLLFVFICVRVCIEQLTISSVSTFENSLPLI